MSLSSTLSSRLLARSETKSQYTRATESAFLRLAGQGRLPRDALSEWLSQDRLYAQAYVRFIGGLLSRVTLPVAQASVATVEWRVIIVLKDALEGIVRELAFFEEMAKKYDLNLATPTDHKELSNSTNEFGANAVTAAYVQLFDSFGASIPGANTSTRRSLFDGLVLLWATEKVYLDAWTYAKQQGQSKPPNLREDSDGGALRNEFIPNWTSDEFVAFVSEIETCLNDYAKAYNDSGHENAAVEIWKQVLQLEEGFWPNVDLKDVTAST